MDWNVALTPFAAGLVSGSVVGSLAPASRWATHGGLAAYAAWLLLYAFLVAVRQRSIDLVPMALAIQILWGALPFTACYLPSRFLTSRLRVLLVGRG